MKDEVCVFLRRYARLFARYNKKYFVDCDQSNVYSSLVIFSTISQDLPFRLSLYTVRRG